MTSREEQVKDMLQNIAKDISAKLPDDFGFTLLAYEFGDEEGKKMLYVSNSKDRKSICTAMKEWIAKTEGENFGKDV